MDDEDSQVLIIVDDIEYHKYLEGYPSPEKISKDEMEYFNEVLSKHFMEIPERNEIIFKHNDKKLFFRGTILKKIEPSTFIMKNSSYYKIWPFDFKGWTIYMKDYQKMKEDEKKKEHLWQLYKANKVFIFLFFHLK